MNPSSTSRHGEILCGEVPPANQTTDDHPEWKLCFPALSYIYRWTTWMKLVRLLTALEFLSNIRLEEGCSHVRWHSMDKIILLWRAKVMLLHLLWDPILSNHAALPTQIFQCHFFHSPFLYKLYSALLLFLSTLSKSKPICNGKNNFPAVYHGNTNTKIITHILFGAWRNNPSYRWGLIKWYQYMSVTNPSLSDSLPEMNGKTVSIY
jgi:hypothetical protein